MSVNYFMFCTFFKLHSDFLESFWDIAIIDYINS